jgi:Protein of unknown function (DUF2505)
MRFATEQRYPAPPPDVIAAYLDPALFDSLTGLDPVRAVEVVDIAQEGQSAYARVRYQFTAALPSAARALVDPARLTWVQESRFDLGAGSERLVIVPDHYGNLLAASADVSYGAAPGGGTLRAVAGELTVHGVPFFLRGKVERVLVDGLTAHLRQEQDAVTRHLR